jgi:hypothetical protein
MMRIADVKSLIGGMPHVKVKWNADLHEYRVAYKGLLPAREEAMAYYTDDPEDAIGTARTMERDYQLQVFNADKLPATLRAEMA